MPLVDGAFYTQGDTRDPNSLPGRRRGRGRPARRVRFDSVSDTYRAYCRAQVGRRGAVLSGRNSREALQILRAWVEAHDDTEVRNVFFVGHGNRFFSWAVRIDPSSGDVQSPGDGHMRSAIEHWHRHGDRVAASSSEYLLIRELTSRMPSEEAVRRIEVRACYLVQSTIDDLAVAFYAARASLRFEARSYSNYYAIIASSRGGFRAEVHDRDGERVLERAPGTRAPDADLLACASAEGLVSGAGCD